MRKKVSALGHRAHGEDTERTEAIMIIPCELCVFFVNSVS